MSYRPRIRTFVTVIVALFALTAFALAVSLWFSSGSISVVRAGEQHGLIIPLRPLPVGMLVNLTTFGIALLGGGIILMTFGDMVGALDEVGALGEVVCFVAVALSLRISVRHPKPVFVAPCASVVNPVASTNGRVGTTYGTCRPHGRATERRSPVP